MLEIGCGVALLPAMFPVGFLNSYKGVDVSPVAIEQAIARFPRGNFICETAEALNLQDETFDLIVFNESLYFLKDFATFDRYLNALRAGGSAVISITHIEASFIEKFETAYAPLIKAQNVILDAVSKKSWTVYLIPRPNTTPPVSETS